MCKLIGRGFSGKTLLSAAGYILRDILGSSLMPFGAFFSEELPFGALINLAVHDL